MQGGHDERGELKGTIAGQSFTLITKDLLPILLLLAGLVGGYLVWVQLDKRLEASGRFILDRLEVVQAHHVKFYELLLSTRENTREETERLLRAIAILNYNVAHPPEQHLPLGLNGPPPPAPRP